MKKLFTLLCFILTHTVIFAQGSISPSFSPYMVVCPGATDQFTFSDPNGNASSYYKWEITKGKANNTTEVCQQGFAPIYVTWDADLNTDGKVAVYRVANCSSPASSGTLVASENIRKFNYPAANTVSNSTTNCNGGTPALTCGTAQTITITFWLDNNTNNSDYSGSKWEVLNNTNCITVPSGWSVSSVNYSNTNHSCSYLSQSFNESQVTLTLHTDGVHVGNVKMRVHGICEGNYGNFYGDWSTATFSIASPGTPSFSSTNTLTFCDGTTGKSVTASASGATSYQWTAPAGYLINGVSNTLTTTSGTVTITAPSAANGEAVLTVVGKTACSTSSSSAQLNMYYGYPNYSYSLQPLNGAQQFCTNSFGNTMTITPAAVRPGIDYYEWGYVNIYSTDPPVVVNPTGTDTQDFSFSTPGSYQIYARQVNSCGKGTTITYNINVADCAGGGFGSFVASPNPATTSINIAKQPANTTPTNTQSSDTDPGYNYTLYDKQGRVIRSGSSKQGKDAKIDIAELQNDTYYLHILYHKKVVVKQIIVKH